MDVQENVGGGDTGEKKGKEIGWGGMGWDGMGQKRKEEERKGGGGKWEKDLGF